MRTATVTDMSAASVVVGLISGVVGGGAAGWLSSVFAAGPVARRQETTRRRLEAQRQLSGVVNTYLGKLDIGRPGQRGPHSPYTDNYADLASREQLAIDVLRFLPSLPENCRQRIGVTLQVLVGNEALNVAKQRASVPPEALPDTEVEAKRREMAERHLRLDYHDGMGCKAETNRFCERDHFPPARRDHGEIGILWLTRIHPHGGYHDQEYEETTRLLREILNEAGDHQRQLSMRRLWTKS
jgi:hypothetical protein